MQTYWLSTHVGYACRHSGACCSSRWPIPIERDQAAGVQRAIDEGSVSPVVTPWFRPDPIAPGDVAGVLAHQPDGPCVFHGPAGCAIYSTRPRSCEHFPFVCVIDARGVHVTLSHYCPTAAEILFRPGEPEIVAGPSVFADGRVPEGLDARESLPPTDTERAEDTDGAADGADGAADDAGTAADFTDDAGTADLGLIDRSVGRRPASRRPRTDQTLRLMAWDEVMRWEQQAVHVVAKDGRVPEAPDLALFDHARAAVPPGWSWPEAPPAGAHAWAEWVAPAWPTWSAVVGRYLAGKVHASWAMYLGSGPADVMRGVDIARAALMVEAARQCDRARRALDKPLLKEAIRQTDLLLMHYADPHVLARS
jgi:Fe-S-cluster containining protein